MIIKYNTRDGKGNDIVKDVVIKEYPVEDVEFECPICHEHHSWGCRTKKIVSSNFTDWQKVGDYVCVPCSRLFSIYFYSYVVDPDGIHLYNVRELKNELTRPQKPPFLFCITTTQKKHLFYNATWNHAPGRFAVNLENETIYTTNERMSELFDFVECLQTLGASKEAMKKGEIGFQALQKAGMDALKYLEKELKTREIQIPLYCGQKRDIGEEEAKCIITSTLTK